MPLDRPVSIAFCITELDPGGAERALVELVRRLDRRRFEPTVYCLGPRPAGNPSLADELEQAGVRVHTLGARQWWQAVSTVLKLRRLLQTDRPRIVQSFLFHANFLGTLVAHSAGVPHILTGIRVAERHSNWHLILARWTSRWVDRHVCVSQDVARFTVKHLRVPESRCAVIVNGVDVDRFSQAIPASLTQLGLGEGRRAILFVGRLEKQKGLPWLIDVLPAALAQLPNHDLLIAGDGTLRQKLERAARDADIGNRVHFRGFRNDIPNLLAASDLLVLPSRWEGMPNVVLEAMAAGTPVVATPVEGVAELLGPQADAQIASRETFINKLAGLLSNPQLAARLGRENQARARECFSWRRMVDAYEQLYDEVLAADDGPRERSPWA